MCLLDLIKDSPFVEVRLLRFLPSAEHLVDGEQIHLREGFRELLRDRFEPGPIKVLGSDLSALPGYRGN